MGLMEISSVVYFFSLSFIVFALATLALYWSSPRKARNVILLIASYVFYCTWDYRFLSLVIFSTVVDYYAARMIEDKETKRKFFLVVSLSTNLTVLFIFKYCQFFVDSFVEFASVFGMTPGKTELNIILPLGISFYTFQSMSYVIDVYRKKMQAHRSFREFALFVSYFPQLIAGPIERAGYLLPQILREKKWSDVPVKEAIYLFSWGFFKKRVIADYLELAINNGYATQEKPGLMTLLGFLAIVFKLYADISGYADMARGVSLLFGIRLSTNFLFPYFSKNPSEYWKRWHITLSVWVRHYVFTPLITRFRIPELAIIVTFLVMGAWLGPQLHFLLWGLYWGICVLTYQYFLKWNIWQNWFMLVMIFLGQTFFHATGLTSYVDLLLSIGHNFSDVFFLTPYYYKAIFIVTLFMGYDYYLYKKQDELLVSKLSFYHQAAFYGGLFFLYRNIGQVAATDFVYFQH
ncbi:MAG: MBOAT family O-acyltransferase [Bdellovibrionota bacterium]